MTFISRSLRQKQQALFPLLILMLASVGCDALNPNRQIMTRTPTRVVSPSPEVQRLLSAQRTQDAESQRFWSEQHTRQEGIERTELLMRSPETIYPGRQVFLSSMASQPAELAPANVYLRLLEDSHVKCSSLMYTTNFIRVRVTSGPLDGHVGWVCEDDVFRTVVWP
jgi:hypothetical protein